MVAGIGGHSDPTNDPCRRLPDETASPRGPADRRLQDRSVRRGEAADKIPCGPNFCLVVVPGTGGVTGEVIDARCRGIVFTVP